MAWRGSSCRSRGRARPRWSRTSRSSPSTRCTRWPTSSPAAPRCRRCPRRRAEPAEPAVLDPPDMCDVRGHDALLPAVLVAAAGGHNLFLHGPPGTGKTMLARRVPSILPPLGRAARRSRSPASTRSPGLHSGGGLVEARPFRAPHHTISPSGLVGGGAVPTPGEVTLAHHGVLFLDELSEFARSVAGGAAPAARGRARGDRALAAGDAVPDALHARGGVEPVPVRARRPPLPLLRRRPRPPPAPASAARCSTASTSPSRSGARRRRPCASSARPPPRTLRERVVAARERQSRRFAGLGVACNAQMTPRMVPRAGRRDAERAAAALRAPRPRRPVRARPPPRPARRAHRRRPRGLRRRSAPSTSPPRSRTARTRPRTGVAA